MKKFLFVTIIVSEILMWIMAVGGVGTYNIALGWAVFFLGVSMNARSWLTSMAQEEIRKIVE